MPRHHGSQLGRALSVASPVFGLLERLHPQAGVAEVVGAALLRREQIAASNEALGEEPVAWALEQAALTLTEVERHFAAISDLPRQQIGLSLEALALDLLAAVGPAPAPRVAPQFVPPMAREAARLLVPFGEVIRSMRITQAHWVRALFAAGGPDIAGPAASAELVTTASRIFDEEVGRFLEAYIAEREAVVESQMARRRDLVAALLADDEATVTPRLTTDLGIDLTRFHTGVVVTRAARAPSLDTRRLGCTLREAVEGAQVLVVPAGDDRVWAWVSTTDSPGPLARVRLGSALATVSGARSAIGSPAMGTVGFRETHQQAHDAATLLTDDPRGNQVTFWRDHALLALLALDPQRARRFVRHVLGPLAEDTGAAREQRLTLQAYFDSGHSLLHAAERRGVHRNTIVYRLKRVEEALGTTVTGDDLELRCALVLAERVLPTT